MENDTVHSFVLSLNSTEKADFKKYVRYNSGKRIPDYEELFDIYNKLEKQQLSNEVFQIKLEKYIKKKPSIQNNLANIRMRLKQRLLQSLVMAQFGKNNKQFTQNLISEIQVLIDRRLYAESHLKLKQAKKYAFIYDLNNLATEIIDYEIFLLGKQSTKNDNVLLEKLIDEQNQFRNLYDIEIDLKNIFCKVTLMVERDPHLTKQSTRNELVSIMKNSKLGEIAIEEYKQQNNIHIAMWYYRTKNLYHRTLGENNKAHQYSKALIEYFESDKKRIKNFETEYIKALCSYTRACFRFYKSKALLSSIEKVQQIYKKKKVFSALKTTCDMGILCYLRTYDYEKAVEISELMDNIWIELVAKLDDGRLLWYAHTNAILHWVCTNRAAFKNWTNRGLMIDRPNKGSTYFYALRMLDLMSNIDNDDLFTFKEKLEALQKTLQNNEHLTNFEKVVLQHFRAFYNIEFSNKNINLKQSEKEDLIQQNFQSLKTELLKLEFKNSPINYGEVMLWCESHLQNKTIKQVFEAGNYT